MSYNKLLPLMGLCHIISSYLENQATIWPMSYNKLFPIMRFSGTMFEPKTHSRTIGPRSLVFPYNVPMSYNKLFP